MSIFHDPRILVNRTLLSLKRQKIFCDITIMGKEEGEMQLITDIFTTIYITNIYVYLYLSRPCRVTDEIIKMLMLLAMMLTEIIL